MGRSLNAGAALCHRGNRHGIPASQVFKAIRIDRAGEDGGRARAARESLRGAAGEDSRTVWCSHAAGSGVRGEPRPPAHRPAQADGLSPTPQAARYAFTSRTRRSPRARRCPDDSQTGAMGFHSGSRSRWYREGGEDPAFQRTGVKANRRVGGPAWGELGALAGSARIGELAKLTGGGRVGGLAYPARTVFPANRRTGEPAWGDGRARRGPGLPANRRGANRRTSEPAYGRTGSRADRLSGDGRTGVGRWGEFAGRRGHGRSGEAGWRGGAAEGADSGGLTAALSASGLIGDRLGQMGHGAKGGGALVASGTRSVRLGRGSCPSARRYL
jgi:hypothetical protein